MKKLLRLYYNKYFYIIICIFQFTICNLQLVAQSPCNLPIRNYSYLEYNASKSNSSIVQDKRGVMYFGNVFGVLEYDGIHWRTIITTNETSVRSLCVDNNGIIYVGAQGEFGFLAPDSSGKLGFNSLLPFVNEDEQDFSDVWETYANCEGVFFRTSEKLFRWKDQNIRTWSPETAFHVMFFVPFNDGNFRKSQLGSGAVISEISAAKEKTSETPSPKTVGSQQSAVGKTIGNQRSAVRKTVGSQQSAVGDIYIRQWEIGLMRVEGDSLVPVPGTEQFAFTRIYGMFPIDQDQIMIVTRGKGLFIMDHSNVEYQNINAISTPADQFLLESQVYYGSLIDNKLSIGTIDHGALIIDFGGNILRYINTNNGLHSDVIGAQFYDAEKTLWMALDNGIAKIDINSPVTFGDRSTGITGSVKSIIRHNGILYAGTSDGVFYLDIQNKMDEGVFTTYRFEPIQSNIQEVWNMLSIKYPNNKMVNSLMVASSYGIYNLRINKKPVLLADDLSYVLHQSILDHSLVFAGLAEGIIYFKWTGNRWINKGKITGIDEEIQFITEVNKGELWLGTFNGGVLKIDYKPNDNFKVTRYTSANGLPRGTFYVNEILDDVIFASEIGIFRYFPDRNDTFIADPSFGVQFADGSRYIHRISEDLNGNIWINSVSGNKFEIGYAIPQKDLTFNWYNTPFLNIQQEIYDAIYHDHDNVTWLGGEGGVIRYDPKIEYNFGLDFVPLIRKVLISGDSVIFWGAYNTVNPMVSNDTIYMIKTPSNVQPELFKPVLPFEFNSLRFEFALPDYRNEKANQYQYMLEGFDKKWSKWKNENIATYTNLPSDKFLFKVRARNVYQYQSDVLVYEFTILPPFHRTWWFYGIQIGVIAMFFGLAYFFGRGGTRSWIATMLATVSIFILFEYFQTYVEDNFEERFGGIIFLKVLLNVILGVTLLPVEKILIKMLIKKKIEK